jgi:V/A-type H+/Na+-transporting ATPase subunit D
LPHNLKIRPTKIELVKLKRRLALSRRVKKILKDRLAILTMQFIETARAAIGARRRVGVAVAQASRATAVAGGFHGAIAFDKMLAASAADVSVKIASRNIAGARVPSLDLNLPTPAVPGYGLARSSSLVDAAALSGRETLRAIIELAELQRTLELLGSEIQRTRRISNALEFLVIPGFERNIRSLSIKFEERDREEKVRLKHIKIQRAHAHGGEPPAAP